MRALIVDDSEPICKMLSMMLQRLGFEPLVADNAFSTLSKLSEYHPLTVALIDWVLPGADGIDLVKQIRQQKRFARLKIIMTTAHSEAEYRA